MKNHWLDRAETIKPGMVSDEEWVNNLLKTCTEAGEKLVFKCLLEKYKEDYTVLKSVYDFVAHQVDEKKLDCNILKKTGLHEYCPKCGQDYWPLNSETTMGQGDRMCACNENMVDLDIYYSTQFVQNEEPILSDICRDLDGKQVYVTTFTLGHKPVSKGTLSGTIYVGAEKIQFFTISCQGVFTFEYASPWNAENVQFNVKDGSFSDTMGKIYLGWTGEPKNAADDAIPVKLIVSYEYNME